MVMNNQGQSMLFGLMLMVFIFFTAVILIAPLKEGINIGREGLDCTNSSITTGQKATCVIVDGYLPYFIGTVLVASSAYVFYRMNQG